MNNRKENKPKIRFSEFTDDWEQRKLEEVVGVYDGTHQTPNYQDHGIMFVSVEDIQTLTSEKYISVEEYEKNYSVVPEKGDILMTRIGDIGTANIVKSAEPLAYYVSLALLKNKGLNAECLKANITAPAFQHELWLRTLHTAYPKKINKDEIGKCLISIAPSCEEQEQIGKFFDDLDNLITLHQCKYDKLILLKKSSLQKMFPQKGCNVPEIRFSGFTNDWEQRKLEDIVNSVDTGKSKFDKNCTSGVYPILGSTSVIGYDDEYDYEGDFILTARVGANAGSLYRYAGKVKISDNTVFIQASENIEFLYYLLTRFDIKKLSFGTGQPLVKASELKNLELMMPSEVKEQMKIGEYFKSLDNLITLHQRELDKLLIIKKSLLNKMFV